jgi:predicted nuclease of predicted toxin-antitoxin system
MRFLLDMGISVDVAAFLRSTGHDAEHLHELRLGTLSDPGILAFRVGTSNSSSAAPAGYIR